MLRIVCFILLVIGCRHFGNAQTVKSADPGSSSINLSVTLDTLLQPDYFEVEFTVCEFMRYRKSGRRWDNVFMGIDSAEVILKETLAMYGLHGNMVLKAIKNRTDTYNGIYKTGIFQYFIYGRDTLELLARKLKSDVIIGMKSAPRVNEKMLNQLKQQLQNRAKEILANQADSFGERNKVVFHKSIYEAGYFTGDRVNQIAVSSETYYYTELWKVSLEDVYLGYMLTITFAFLPKEDKDSANPVK